MINRVILVGRLTKNPEIRKTPNGVSICKFTLAVSRKVKAQGQPDADFISCVAWNKTADLMYQYLKKGSRVYLEGRLRTRKWEKDGQTHYSTEILADTLQLIDRKSDVVGGGQSYAPQSSGDGFESPAAPRRSEFTSGAPAARPAAPAQPAAPVPSAAPTDDFEADEIPF